MKPKDVWPMARAAVRKFGEDGAAQHSAAMAYYAILSLPALAALVIGILGLIFGRQAVEHDITRQLGTVLSREGAQSAAAIIRNTMQRPGSNVVAVVISAVVLVISAFGLFSQLQYSLDAVWGVAPKRTLGFWGTVKQRLPALAMIGLAAVVLASSVIVSSGINAYGPAIPILGYSAAVMQLLNFLFYFVLAAVLFALIFRYLPDVRIGWREVWFGALVTAFLFAVGQFLLSLYFGLSHVASTYGATGGLILILVWIYYSMMIFLFGAEVTKVHAAEHGTAILPKEQAERVTVVRGEAPPQARAA